MNKDWILKTDLKSPCWGEEEQTSHGDWEAEAYAWGECCSQQGASEVFCPLKSSTGLHAKYLLVG